MSKYANFVFINAAGDKVELKIDFFYEGSNKNEEAIKIQVYKDNRRWSTHIVSLFKCLGVDDFQLKSIDTNTADRNITM